MVSVGASLAFSDQTATVGQDGRTVTVDSVTLRDGGFVTIHDSRLGEGEVLASVVGTSQYLSAGTHENVTVTVGPGVEDGETLVAMPHRDTNGNQAYDFVASQGASDGPYVAGGGAVVDTGTVSVPMQASVEFADQETSGNAVIVRNVSLSRGGFVTLHDSSLTDGDAIGSVVGTSTYLEPGFHAQVIVSLNEPLEEDQTLIAMPHIDTNGNQAYDFVETEGSADGPYVSDGSAVTASADVSLATETTTAMDGTTTMDGTTAMGGTTMAGDTATATDDGGDGGAPGFGVGVALVALLAVAALARRRR
jgi:PGF-CTERM protein